MHDLNSVKPVTLQNLRIPLDKAVEMVLNNEIPDSKTQVGILKTAALVEKGLL